MTDYNYDLCEERHGFITAEFAKHDWRIKKVENRFLAIITTLTLNLVGVIAILVINLTK